jgi:hypothetical protein
MGACQRVFNPRVTFGLALYETRLLYPSQIVPIAYKQHNPAFLLKNRSPIGTIALTKSLEHQSLTYPGTPYTSLEVFIPQSSFPRRLYKLSAAR